MTNKKEEKEKFYDLMKVTPRITPFFAYVVKNNNPEDKFVEILVSKKDLDMEFIPDSDVYR